MTLHDKFCRNCSSCFITLIIISICIFIDKFINVNETYNTEYWKFQNNSFNILQKGTFKRKLTQANYILEQSEFNSLYDIFFVLYGLLLIHNNTYYVNSPFRCLNLKINFYEVYDYFIHNLIFNFIRTFFIASISFLFLGSNFPVFPFYPILLRIIILHTMEKFSKIMILNENKTSWNFFIQKTE